MRPILAVWLLAASGLWAQVTPSGTYEAPLQVEVSGTEAQVRYRFLDSASGVFSPWPGSLVLDAMPGESRVYSLRIAQEWPSGEGQTKDYRYTVRRPAGPVATVVPEPGRYTGGVTVQAKVPPGWAVRQEGKAVTFPLVLDTEPGRQTRFVLEASGPSDQRLVWVYTIDRRDQEVASLDLLSPKEGVWKNAQTLAAVFRGVDQVVWNYGAQRDPNTAVEYTGPVLLDRPGPQTVTVAGHLRSESRWIEAHVTWTNGSGAPAGMPPQGARPEGVEWPDLSASSVSWDEGRSWGAGPVRSAEAASTEARKVLAVQIRGADGVSRSFYWLDGRTPDQPGLRFEGGWNPRLVFEGSQALHEVVWTRADGQPVEEPEHLWGPIGAWKVPDGMVAARVKAVGANGLESPAATLGFPETGWSTPGWEPLDSSGPTSGTTGLPLGGRVPPRPGFWPVYEVSDRPDVPEPTPASPVLTGAFVPSLPWGSDRTFYVRLAWRDAAGLVGPGSTVHAVRVDRVPPAVPEVVVSGGQVIVKVAEGEEEGGTLWWAVSPERAVSAEALTFQPYSTALEASAVRSGQTGTLWFHARAQDRSGNSGPARLNIALPPPQGGPTAVVQVDSNPDVGESPVEEGGVYPWSSFRLRSLDQGKDLWVGVADQGAAVPSDWTNRVQPWNGVLSRGIARGERRSFLVYWNAKTPEGWLWPQPKTLNLTLDLSPPAPPAAATPWPEGPLPGPWTLELQPSRSGDQLKYTFSLDGSVPADPLLAGEPWPGSRTWQAPPQGRLVLRLRVAAISVSGLGVETSLGAPVVLDQTLPATVSPELEPFTYRSAPFVIPAPKTGRVRYTLTSDGRLPEVPGEESPLLPPSGLRLEGRPGESTLYRLRWRAFSASGVGGATSDAYGVLIDLTNPPGTSPSGPTPEAVPLRLTGIPPRGLAKEPVTLDAEGPPGLVRFEVREGWGPPRAVGPDSALWKGPLVLDSGDGLDRSYAVGLRAFSPDGVPLTEEVVYPLRIDRSRPALPAFDLTLESRRPEAVLTWAADRNPDETLVYRWRWDAFGVGTGEGPWLVYDQPAVFTAPGGALTRLRLEAYLQDAAGNVGPTAERSLLIDQNVVYLAPTGKGDGTRNAPAGDLNAAVDQARREGRSVLLAAAGTYAARKTLDLSGLTVSGGLGPEWEGTPEPGRSVWTASAGFRGANLIESGAQAWSLTSVDLSGTAKLDALVSVRGGTASVRNGAWNWSGTSLAWDQEGGKADLTNLVLTVAAEPRGGLLRWKGVEARAKGLRLTATQNQGGTLVVLQDSTALFQDLVLISKRAVGFDGVWSASGSQFTVDQARIQAGDGAERVAGFVLKDTDAAFWNTEVSLYGAGSNTGFQTTNGRLEVQKGSLSLLAGREFNQGFVLDRTAAVLSSFDLKVEGGAYQGGFSVDGGSLTVGASRVRLAGGGQRVWGGQFLSAVEVRLQDVTWTLVQKTPGELWKREQPWGPGSSVTGSITEGW